MSSIRRILVAVKGFPIDPHLMHIKATTAAPSLHSCAFSRTPRDAAVKFPVRIRDGIIEIRDGRY